jgi:ATP-grasp domain
VRNVSDELDSNRVHLSVDENKRTPLSRFDLDRRNANVVWSSVGMLKDESVFEDLGSVVPKVLLTATNRWPSPSRMAIGLGKAGCSVSAVCPTSRHPLLCTRAVQKTFPYSSFHPIESLIAAVEATNPDIIIPSDDRGVQHLHELHAYARNLRLSGTKLANLIEYSLGPSDSYRIVSSRCELLRIAREEGIRVPDTRSLTTQEDLASWKAEHAFPWVLKGDGTFGGKGVRIAQTEMEAEKFYSEISRLFGAARVLKRAVINRDPFWLRPWWNNHKPVVSIQSYIQGRPANCAFVCWRGEVLGVIGVEVVSSEGQTGPADIVRLIDNAEMVFASEQIARRLSLTGFFGLDFMIGEDDGATYLIELNPRCTPLSHLQLGRGRDLIEAFNAKLLRRPVREVPPITQNDLIAYFPQVWQCRSEFVQSSFHDIPEGEPELVEDQRRPWPDRSLLYRMVSKMSAITSFVNERRTSKHGLTNL